MVAHELTCLEGPRSNSLLDTRSSSSGCSHPMAPMRVAYKNQQECHGSNFHGSRVQIRTVMRAWQDSDAWQAWPMRSMMELGDVSSTTTVGS